MALVSLLCQDVRELQIDPSCQVSIRLQQQVNMFGQYEGPLHCAHRLGVWVWCSASWAEGCFQDSLCTKLLHICWPAGLMQVSVMSPYSKREQRHCISNVYQPEDILEATTMHGIILAGLPDLQELMVMGETCNELSLKDPVFTSSRMKTFIVFGQPQTTDAADMLSMSDCLGHVSCLSEVCHPGAANAVTCGPFYSRASHLSSCIALSSDW